MQREHCHQILELLLQPRPYAVASAPSIAGSSQYK